MNLVLKWYQVLSGLSGVTFGTVHADAADMEDLCCSLCAGGGFSCFAATPEDGADA